MWLLARALTNSINVLFKHVPSFAFWRSCTYAHSREWPPLAHPPECTPRNRPDWSLLVRPIPLQKTTSRNMWGNNTGEPCQWRKSCIISIPVQWARTTTTSQALPVHIKQRCSPPGLPWIRMEVTCNFFVGAYVGGRLFFAGIQRQVTRPLMNADDLTLVDIDSRSQEKIAPLLTTKQSVRGWSSSLKSNLQFQRGTE